VESVDRYPNGRSGADDTTAVHEVFRKGTRVMIKATGNLGRVVQPYMTGVMQETGTRFPALHLIMDNGDSPSVLMGDVSLVSNCTCTWLFPEDAEKFGHEVTCPLAEEFTPLAEDKTFYCPNCETDILVGFEDSHNAPCGVCGGDGHSLCQHPYNAKEGRYVSDYTAGNADMVDTMTNSYDVWAELEIAVTDGVAVNIGWHCFTITADKTEFDIPDMYGSLHGSGNPRDGWASVITVLDSYAA
jgi:hypothetical protein